MEVCCLDDTPPQKKKKKEEKKTADVFATVKWLNTSHY